MKELKVEVKGLSIKYEQLMHRIAGFTENIDSIKRAFIKLKRGLLNRKRNKTNALAWMTLDRLDKQKQKTLLSRHVTLKTQLHTTQLSAKTLRKELRNKGDKLEECVIKVRMSAL
jgi:hypothetical protein